MAKRVYFRADAGHHIGYGHFIRSLALADILKDRFECYFVTQSPTSYQKEEVGKVCQLIELPADHRKFDLFLEYLKGDEIVVLDNYFYEEEYKEKIKRKGSILVCIDDYCHLNNFTDAIINYGVEDCNLFQTNTHAKLCLGLDWVLLRAPFLSKQFFLGKGRNQGHWIVCFGGSDENDFTGKICRILEDLPEVVSIKAIIGDGYEFQDKLTCLKKVEIAKNLSALQLAELFYSAKYAVLSSSTIALEALACGITVWSGWYVENQKNLYNILNNNQYIFPLDNLNELKNSDFIHLLYDGMPKKDSLKEFMTKGIPERYIQLFNSLINQGQYYIFYDYIDLDLDQHRAIWEVRNLEMIRKWMVNKEPFSFENHLSFVDSLKKASDKKYWAIYDDTGRFLGSYSITHIKDNTCERGLFITPDCSGKGVASRIEDQADDYLRGINIKEVHAEVLKNNINSIRYHLKQGYKQMREDETFYYYVKYLS